MKLRFLNGNVIKLLAVLFMTLDHIGFLFVPGISIYRQLGRIALPLFAFMIAEGVHYTKNRTQYLSLMFSLGVIFQIVYEIATGDKSEYNIFLTFSLSILMIYALDFAKQSLFTNKRLFEKIVSVCFFLSVTFASYMICQRFPIDYGFAGTMLPVAVSLFDNQYLPKNKVTEILASHYVKVIMLAIALIFLCQDSYKHGFGNSAYFAYFSVLFLLLYDGTKGKWNLKYFFYIYYPAHLVTLAGIAQLIYMLR